MALSAHKVLTALPDPLAPDAIYFVKDGARVRQYVTTSGASPQAYLIQDTGLVDEVAAARGSSTSLTQRIDALGQSALGFTAGPGTYFDGAARALSPVTASFTANRIDLAPFQVAVATRIDQIGVAVSTAGTLGRIMIYEGDDQGFPETLLFASDNLNLAATGYVFQATDMTFGPGKMYWIGFQASAAVVIRAIPLGSALAIGLSAAAATGYFTCIRRSVTFGTGAPSPWSFNPAELAGAVTPPSIRMRVAAF